MAAAEEESVAEGKGKVVRERRCTFRDCVCRWNRSGTPRIAPGMDYVRIPDGADTDHRTAWSLLAGVTDGASSLRLSRIRVARSGRILGRSDDKLEVFRDIVLAKPPEDYFDAGAALAPDGRSLCVLRTDNNEQPQALQLSLQPDTEELPLPEIEGTTPCMPISYDGHIWALSATTVDDIDCQVPTDCPKVPTDCSEDFPKVVDFPKVADCSDAMEWKQDIAAPDYFGFFSVVTRRLLSEPGGGGKRWEQVGDPFTCPLVQLGCAQWTGGFLQGCAVLPGHKLILVSFQQYGLFLTFAPESGCWSPVRTDPKRSAHYLPIHGRGIYVEQHDAVYLLCHNAIYAYKLNHQEDDQGKLQLTLDPPIKIHSICPFATNQGYGYLTRLADRLMCSVWISLAWRHPCPCDDLHAIVTTFHLRDLAQGGIHVLHSTYRRVDMLPDPPNQAFFFLQEFEDESSPALLRHDEEEQDDSSQHVNQPSNKLACCRNSEIQHLLKRLCFKCGGDGHIAHQCTEKLKRTISTIPPFGPSRSIPVDPAIKKDVLIICQAGTRSLIFQTGAMDDDGKPLQACYDADNGDYHWHFFQSGSKINAVSSTKDGMLELSPSKDWTTLTLPVRRPAVDPFIMVVKVGGVTIALTHTLQVYRQERFYSGSSTTWLRYPTKGMKGREVFMSGYVVVNDDSFIICDAATCSCFLFDMVARRWRNVTPRPAFEKDLPRTTCTIPILIGRCVFVDGFIYTCTEGGIAAYELVGGRRSRISNPIFLPFPWHVYCEGKDMCLDYAGKDMESGTISFYVVLGGRSMPKHDVQITSVMVRTTRSAGDKMIPARIDHVVGVTRFIHHDRAINTRCCFAVSCE
ncbi:unnamed protein product [Alopecurus aequalis]